MNIILDDSNRISSDTGEFSDTNEAPHEDNEDLSDEDDNDEADVTSKLHYLTRNLKSDLGEF